MRQETNNEIDLLLRRLSRRDGESLRDGETRIGEIDGRHLDADELSSFAQNVLPPAARARYTEHLIECSTCRKLATELSLAVGVTTAAAPVEAIPAASGLKKFLSSLFAPMVLRYAVPALGVLVVMVIGFVVMRQRAANEGFVAQRTPQAAAGYPQPTATAGPYVSDARPVSEEQNAKAKAQNGPAQPANSAPGEVAGSSAGANETRPSKTAESADTAAAVSAPVVQTPGDVQPFTQRSVSELPVVQPTPPAAPKSNITIDGDTGETKKKQEIDAAKRESKPKIVELQAAKERANEPPADAALRPTARSTADRADQNKAKDDERNAAPAGAAAGAGARTATRRRAEESRDEAETRSVAGRKFRKEGGIWTDTAYDSSTRTINMARSSEQFRALVADEPGIRTIAEQLDGEVIVVWKGRAYRIR